MVDAIRTAKDGEYVTVQGTENDVRVAKQDNHLIVHVLDKESPKNRRSKSKVPMKVIDALFRPGRMNWTWWRHCTRFPQRETPSWFL